MKFCCARPLLRARHNLRIYPGSATCVFTIALTLAIPVANALDASEVYERVARSIVVVEVFDFDQAALTASIRKGSPSLTYKKVPSRQGSGVVIAGGEVITNCHVARRAGGKIDVVRRNRRYKARLRHIDPERDLCQLSVKGLDLPAIRIGRSYGIKPGEPVFAVGAPQGLEMTISNGIISGIRTDGTTRYLQTTAAISPGSSGGGLFNANAELIGITTFQFREGQALNFAIPVEWFSELASRSDKRKRLWTNSGGEKLSLAAMVARSNGDWDALVKLASRLTQLDPYASQYWAYLGTAYAARRDRAKAVQSFRQAIELDPSAENWREFADGYEKLSIFVAGDTIHTDKEILRKARNAIEEALRIAPDDADSWAVSGSIHKSLGDPVRAIKDLNEALRLNSLLSAPWVTLMGIYWETGDMQKATHAARKAVANNPDNWAIWAMVYIMAEAASDTALRRRAYSNLKRLNPEMAERLDERSGR